MADSQPAPSADPQPASAQGGTTAQLAIEKIYVKDLSLLGFAMFNASADEQRECASAINDLYVRGGWHPAIGITLPLSQAAAAHQLQQDNTLDKKGTLAGKIVLVPDA